MRLDQVAIAIRPRQPWEAVDLGFTMVRAWWWRIYAPWLVIMVPSLALIVGLCAQADMLWLGTLLVWWLKPLFDRIPLYVLSHGVFGEPPSVAQTLRALPALWRMSPLWGLFLRRFNLSRSFDLPVMQLEGLRGKAQRERVRILRKGAASTATWHTVACSHFEALANLSLFGLLFLVLPQQLRFELFNVFLTQVWENWFEWLASIVYLLGVLLIEPLYVAGGFGLYLNRRILLEGWDIELAFRRMAERLAPMAGVARAAAAILLGIALTFALPPQESLAAAPTPTPEVAKQRIQKVLQDSAFNTKETVTDWRYVGERDIDEPRDTSWLRIFEAFGRGLAMIFKGALWVLLVVVIIWLVLNRARLLRWLRGTQAEVAYIAPQKLFGLDLRPESLPADIAGEALRLWRAGEARAALSLLYRGALVRLIEREGVELRESDTEGDCLRLVMRRAGHDKAAFFGRLTAAWEGVAYAARAPVDGEALCQQWPAHFEIKSS